MVPSDTRLDRGIFRTPHGYRIVLRINGRLSRKRFPPTWTLKALQDWRDDHIKLARSARPARGTFAEDAADYLAAVKAMTSYGDRKRDIESWVAVFGTRPRWKIKPADVRTALHAWRSGDPEATPPVRPLAASTVNHRRTALGHLFSVLDGRSAFNPAREAPMFIEPAPTKRGVPIRLALAAIRRVKARRTRARLLLLLWTGMRPSELMRLQPEDLDLDQATCYVRTAKGGPHRVIPLNRSAVKAARLFVRRDGWGKFSTATMRKMLVAGCKIEPALPALRVYDLRHTFATALGQSADLADVQAHLGHSSSRLTRRYAPVSLEKVRAAAAKVGRK